jgi:hypothetical protein
MDIKAERGVSGLIAQDKQEPDAWRVYFQGRLTRPKFSNRTAAITYLGALRNGQRAPEFVAGHGKEERR